MGYGCQGSSCLPGDSTGDPGIPPGGPGPDPSTMGGDVGPTADLTRGTTALCNAPYGLLESSCPLAQDPQCHQPWLQQWPQPPAASQRPVLPLAPTPHPPQPLYPWVAPPCTKPHRGRRSRCPTPWGLRVLSWVPALPCPRGPMWQQAAGTGSDANVHPGAAGLVGPERHPVPWSLIPSGMNQAHENSEGLVGAQVPAGLGPPWGSPAHPVVAASGTPAHGRLLSPARPAPSLGRLCAAPSPALWLSLWCQAPGHGSAVAVPCHIPVP